MTQVAIAGVHATRQAPSIDVPVLSLLLEAVRGVLDDAGIAKEHVDGICGRWPGPGGTVFMPGSADWAGLLGIPVRWIGDTYPQGVPALLDAAAAIQAGYCETVLVVGGQSRTRIPGADVAAYTRPDNGFVAPWGALTAAHFALVAQRYLHLRNPDRLKIAAIAAEIRNAGSRNPEAVMRGRGPYTAADVLASPPIAEPLRLLELCLANDGAAAMLITSVERARDLRKPPIALLGGGAEWRRQQYVDPPRFEETWSLGKDAVTRTFGAAGVSPADIDVLEIYDINAFEVVRQFELLGYCGEGEGAEFAAERGIGIGGGLPTNTDGGLLSYSHIGWGAPTLKIVEAVRQLRGEAPRQRQVEGAELALVSGAGSGAQYYNLAVLGRAA